MASLIDSPAPPRSTSARKQLKLAAKHEAKASTRGCGVGGRESGVQTVVQSMFSVNDQLYRDHAGVTNRPSVSSVVLCSAVKLQTLVAGFTNHPLAHLHGSHALAQRH